MGARYIVARYDCENSMDDFLEKVILDLAGVLGLSQVRPSVVHAGSGGLAVIRVERSGLEILRAALALQERDCLKIIKVAGTLRKALETLNSLSKSLSTKSI